jgi:hypothetical protein
MGWSLYAIKVAHDRHIHYVDGQPVEFDGCPNCEVCRCPVHVKDIHAPVPTEAAAREALKR